MAARRMRSDSPFDALEQTFDLLVSAPSPLALEGGAVAGLPDRVIALGELRAILLHPSTAYEVRDAALDELVARARARGGPWAVGLAGVLLPGLRRAVWGLVRACPVRAADIEAEALVALLQAASTCERGRPRLAARLCWLARSGAQRVLRDELAERARPAAEAVSAAPPRPWGHPDLVLEKAVAAGVICAADAQLIGATRLGDEGLAEVAADLGIAYGACHQRRRRAEAALVTWMRSDDYPPFSIVEPAMATRCSSRGGRPRQGRATDRRPDKRRSTPTTRR